MDQEEVQREIEYLVNLLGPQAETLHELSLTSERIDLFQKLRSLIHEKDLANDQIAVEILSWAWQEMSK